jgi:hypothetical protein
MVKTAVDVATPCLVFLLMLVVPLRAPIPQNPA